MFVAGFVQSGRKGWTAIGWLGEWGSGRIESGVGAKEVSFKQRDIMLFSYGRIAIVFVSTSSMKS